MSSRLESKNGNYNAGNVCRPRVPCVGRWSTWKYCFWYCFSRRSLWLWPRKCWLDLYPFYFRHHTHQRDRISKFIYFDHDSYYNGPKYYGFNI